MQQSTHPSFAEFVERGIAENSLRLIWTRWAAAVLVFAATGFCVHILHLPLPEFWLNVIGGALLAYNALLNLALQRAQRLSEDQQRQQIRRLVIAQVLLDWLAMSMVVHLTGGITSPAIPLFLIHMLMVAILLPAQSPYPYVGLAALALVLIATLEGIGLIPHHRVIPSLPLTLYRDPLYISAQIMFFAVVGFGMVYLTSQIMAQLHKREYQVITLLDTAQTVSSSLDLQEVMQRLTFSAANALGAPGAAIRLLDESGEHLKIAAAYGLSQRYLDKGPITLSRSRLDQQAMHGQSVIVTDVTHDDRLQYPQQALQEGIRSILLVPLVGSRRKLGVLRLYSRQPNAFTDADAAFIMAIGQQGGTALENALMVEAIQQTEQARADYVRTVTHELRAPVVGAQSLLRTLMRGMAGSLTASQSDILERIERRINALADLVNDLLALAASKTMVSAAPLHPLAIQPVLQHLLEQWSTQAQEKSLTVVCDLPDEPLMIAGREDEIGQIFNNLIGNAVKYTPAGGSIRIGAAVSGGSLNVTVSDTGIGIPADDIPKLWDEFFRAQNAVRAEITGTGLGLSIVKRLVERQGALISVESKEGGGTTFCVCFPFPSSDQTLSGSASLN